MVSIIGAFEDLAEKVFPEDFIDDMEKKLLSTNVAFSGSEYIGLTLMIGFLVAIALGAASVFISFPYIPGWVYAIAAFSLIFIVLVYGLPYFLREQRVGELEENLPDALRQMSTALKAGVSMDEALEDVGDSNYGALSEEFERTLAQVRRGRPMEGALRAMADRTGSELVHRAFFLLVEGMERGAELADVLETISDDIRETHTIQRERKSSTTQQVMFLLAASLFAAPFITGLVLELSGVFAEVGGAGGGGAGGGGMGGDGGFGGQVLPPGSSLIVGGFIAIQAAATSLAVGVIRYGEITKGLMYMPLLTPAAVGVYFGAQFALGLML